jgi:hypothetical protein
LPRCGAWRGARRRQWRAGRAGGRPSPPGPSPILPAPQRAPPAQLKDLKTELSALRVAKVTGGAPNKLSKM